MCCNYKFQCEKNICNNFDFSKNQEKLKKMNKEVWITMGLTATAVAIVLVVRDNMPNGFKFKKA